jgi:hypothetical protein
MEARDLQIIAVLLLIVFGVSRMPEQSRRFRQRLLQMTPAEIERATPRGATLMILAVIVAITAVLSLPDFGVRITGERTLMLAFAVTLWIAAVFRCLGGKHK